MKGQDRGSVKASCSNVDDLKKNCFYALRSRGEKETSSDEVTDMLKVVPINFYAILHMCVTLYVATPFVVKIFYNLPDILNEPFIVTTPVGELVIAKRVYRNCPMMSLNRVTHVELVEHELVDFDVILGMDWSYACLASIDYRTRVLEFIFPNEPILEWKRDILFLEVVSFLV